MLVMTSQRNSTQIPPGLPSFSSHPTIATELFPVGCEEARGVANSSEGRLDGLLGQVGACSATDGVNELK